MTIRINQQIATRYAKQENEWIKIGKGVQIWGEIMLIPVYDKDNNPLPIIIGNSNIIQHGAVLYGGVTLRDDVRVCHHAIIRENVFIGTHSVIGNLVMIENDTVIGEHVIINDQCHLTGNMKVHSYTFLGPNVTTMNDKTIKWYRKGHGEDLVGPTIHYRARVGAGACLMAEVTIGHDSVIGAGAVVTKNVPACEMWVGVPAQMIKKLDYPKLVEDSFLCEKHYINIDKEQMRRLGFGELTGFKIEGNEYGYKSIG